MLELHIWLIKKLKAHNKNGTFTALTFLITVKPVLRGEKSVIENFIWTKPLLRGHLPIYIYIW